MLEVTLLGTGGMMPLPDRALTSLYVRCDGRALLIDCGEGTQTAIRKAGVRFKAIDAILITHFHADHISGLPGLLLTLGNEGRTETLTMYGPRGLEETVNALRVIVPELPYEIAFREFDRGCTESFSCCGLEGLAFPADHGMTCFGYRLERKRPGKFDPDAAKAKNIPLRLWSRLQNGEEAEGFRPEDVLGAPRKGIRLLYATDTRPVPAITELGRGADLMILEGMFGDPDRQLRAEETGHMMMQEAAEIAREADAVRLWLTHYSPANPEPESYEEGLREVFHGTRVCSDGTNMILRFAD